MLTDFLESMESYIGCDDFVPVFSGKVFKFFHAKFRFFFCGLTNFQVRFISFVKRKANSTIEQQKCKGHGKRDRLLISKFKLIFQILLRMKSFT